MSMRMAYNYRTLCEVLREINDAAQGLPNHAIILSKLKEAEAMAKRIVTKLYEYSKTSDKDWWEQNKDYEQDLLRRMA